MKKKRRRYGKVYITYQWSVRRDKYIFTVEDRTGDTVHWTGYFDSLFEGDKTAMEFVDQAGFNTR
jgi:maltose-binding protein MalE